jgi:hypothetical protein
MILFDIAPTLMDNPVGLSIAAGFFLVVIAVAVIAFKMLKRTMKMAMRMAIVGVILLVALIGSIALLFGVSSTTNNRPRPNRPAVNSPR